MIFDRYDIVEAHYALEVDYNRGGVLWERSSNMRRNMSTEFQLSRMGVRVSPAVREYGYGGLSVNGRAIYNALVERYELESAY